MLVLNYIITFLELQKVEKSRTGVFTSPQQTFCIMALAKPVP